jgi:alkylation response protein AidB-like acyl-CoA dehydrogenase
VLVTLSHDQSTLRDTTAKFLDDLMPVAAVRALRDDPAGFPAKYWRQGAELGWTSLLVGEEHGGGTVSGAPLQDLGLIAYEFGVHAAPGPLVPVNVVALALAASDTADHHTIVAGLVSGEATAAWCYAEPEASHGAIDLEIRRDGDELVLSGVKRPVENAGQAEHLLVTGRTDGGLSQVVIPATSPGMTLQPMQTVDLTRRFSVVRFDDVRVPLECAVGELGQADDQVRRQLQVAMVIHNAESVGAMQRAFDMTRSWVADRYSFGRSLDSYQEIKHRFADMLSWLEGSHAITDAAIDALDRGSTTAAELVSASKAFVGRFGGELMQDCVQLHGGIGLTFEHDLHLFLRRVTVNRAMYGTPDDHFQQVGAGVAEAGARDE